MKLNKKTWVAIVLVALCGQIAWTIENNFFNLFIQDVFGANLNQVALMVSASAIAATLTTLFVGAWSDKIGKRKIFMSVGYILWGISILCFAFMKDMVGTIAGTAAEFTAIGVAFTVIFDCVMTFFGSGANDACFNAWLTDITDESTRGKAEGVNSAMPLVSVLLVFGGAIFVSYEQSGRTTYNYTLLFSIIAALVIIVGILNFFLVEDKPIEKLEGNYLSNIAYGFKVSTVKKNPILYLLFLAFMTFSISTQVFMPYYVIYLNKTLTAAGMNYVLVMAPAIVIASIFTIFYGRFIDKYGVIKSLFIPFGMYAVGLVIMTLSINPWVMLVGCAFMLGGFLGTQAVFGVGIRNYTPAESVGAFQGIRIASAVLVPMLIGPWIGSLVSSSSGTNIGFGVVGDDYTPSSFIFLAALVVSLLTWIFVYFVYRKIKKENK